MSKDRAVSRALTFGRQLGITGHASFQREIRT